MKIKDILLWIPVSYIAQIARFPRFELSEKIKEQAINEGLYRVVRHEETADDIIRSQIIRPSNAIVSYGLPCAFMFLGKPSADNFLKNVSSPGQIINPYITPDMVAYAVEIKPPSKKYLNNYKIRSLVDDAIMYEGHCVLPNNCARKVRLVCDLERDESGKPIVNEKNDYSLKFREAKEDELVLPEKNKYKPKDDYLDYITKKSIEYGYKNKDGSNKPSFLQIPKFILDTPRQEGSLMRASVKKNFQDIFYSIFRKNKQSQLNESAEDTLKNFSFGIKNPFRDKKIAEYVAGLQTQEPPILQYDFDGLLQEFNSSKDGYFFQKKYLQIGNNFVMRNLHGLGHSFRTSLLAQIIAQKEGVLANDETDRIKDILATATVYHDIGRFLNTGFYHGKKGAEIVGRLNLRYENGKTYSDNDKRIVAALIELHDTKPSKIDKIIKRYKITDEADIELVKKLNNVVRDADALDRTRFDGILPKYKANLNPQKLVNITSKQLVVSAYQLEYLTRKVPNFANILDIGVTQEVRTQRSQGKFDDKIATQTPYIDLGESLSKEDSKREEKIGDEYKRDDL